MVEEKLESGGNEKGCWCPMASDIGKTATLKGLLEIFHDIEIAKDKIFEANLKLERRTLSYMLYKKENAVQIIFDMFVFNKVIKHLNSPYF